MQEYIESTWEEATHARQVLNGWIIKVVSQDSERFESSDSKFKLYNKSDYDPKIETLCT